MNAMLIIAALCAATPDSPAEQPRFDLDITVETAELVTEPLSSAAPSTTVIGPAEIRASNATYVAELLRRVPGVDVTRSGSAGRVTVARIDGAAASQTLVLLDGVELNSPTLGLADFSDLLLDNVERIEVVRGPMSALYGSQAMGGVINIISRRRGDGARPAFVAEVNGGAFATRGVRVGSSGPIGARVGYTVGVSRMVADGRTYDTPLGELDHDGYENTTVTGRLDAKVGSSTDVSFTARYFDAERDLPIEVFGAQVFDLNATQGDELVSFGGRLATRFGDRIRPRLEVSHTRAKQAFDDPKDPDEDGPFAGDFSADVETARTELRGAIEIDVVAGDLLTAGIEYEDRHGENRDSFSGLNFAESLTGIAVFAQNRFETASLIRDDDRLVITAGARVDDEAGYGTSFNPKVAALWTAANGVVRVRAAAGRGFRAPSLNEVLFPFYGNPDLDPETSRTYEAAIGGRGLSGRFDLEVRGFQTNYDDLIATDPATFTAVNLDRARIRGAEVEARLQPTASLWVRGSLTLQDAEDLATSDELLRRPKRKGSLSLAYEHARRFRLALDLIVTGEQRDVAVASFPEMNDGWTRVDVAGGWTLPAALHGLELFGRVENLFDADYSEATGFPAPGINAYGGVRARF